MFFASSVLVAMCAAADVEPTRLNDTVSARIGRRNGTMSSDDHFPRLFARATGVRVRRLRRRSRYLLLEFDRMGTIYTERGRDDCDFLFAAVLPSLAQIAAIGKRMNEVVDLGVLTQLIGDRVVKSPCEAYEGATAFELEPDWRKFG